MSSMFKVVGEKLQQVSPLLTEGESAWLLEVLTSTANHISLRTKLTPLAKGDRPSDAFMQVAKEIYEAEKSLLELLNKEEA